MRLAFSTLGLPGRPLAEVLRLAASHGWAGLELRCAPGEPVHPEMTAAERSAAARALWRAGVTPLALAGYAAVAAPGEDARPVAELRGQLRLAADLGARHLRVFPRGGDAPAVGADRRAARRLAAVADEAESLGVRILLETHDSHRAGRDVARVLELVDHPAVGALWDVLHTWLAGSPRRCRTPRSPRASATCRSRTSPGRTTSPPAARRGCAAAGRVPGAAAPGVLGLLGVRGTVVPVGRSARRPARVRGGPAGAAGGPTG